MTLRVLSIASEAVPLIKTGGLADVAGALPDAVAPHGVAMTTILPGYPAVTKALGKAKAIHQWDSLLGEPARLLAGKLGSHPLLVVDSPNLFSRDGGPYADLAGRDWGDNWRRFAAFGRAAADVAGGAVKGLVFDLAHAHDWQAAMAPAYMRFAPAGTAIPSVMTIHNMAFQGYYGADIFALLGLPSWAWAIDGVEYHGGVGFLKAGLESASAITTVSPTYAREIRDPAFGMGLEGLITTKGDRVHGIVNGIDPAVWNPETDQHLLQTYSWRSLARRAANKRALEREFHLEQGDGPLFVCVTRLTWQKGIDVLLEVIDHLVGLGGRLALLGAGDPALEAGLHAAAARHPGRVSLRIGYDEALSHRMQGGGDAILVPSRFEPCGLTQLYGLAYGCVPVVAHTGGLADTVVDANLAAINGQAATGVTFHGVTYPSFAAAITRTIALYGQCDVWTQMQRTGMKTDFSWKRSGQAYAALYRQLAGAE
ncbi:glycogen synthase GlgA [Novosphingobium capsulatum]|uniref:glycogen synthase GlgA n=1 Tax=Novosphingobium capsulatum TaxID=13688 RepID=UPI00078870F3|nr:glycogen synthase GlgA [Novosphingobium capsulatum]WQD92270.1 glycogen synthase GlgA [Novosphingobium capsulatum]